MDGPWMAALTQLHAEQPKAKLRLFVLPNLQLRGSKFHLNPIICAKLKPLTNPSSMPGYFAEERSRGFRS